MLTIAYYTARKNPCIGWFFDSLDRELGGDYSGIKVVVVDFHKDSRIITAKCPVVHHVAPKPTVWQGPYRLTRRDYWAAANMRNTAICLAEDGWLANVDDLSVLMPGWMQRVRRAMHHGYVALGSYKKVKDLKVLNGDVLSYVPYQPGVDSRWEKGGDEPVALGGGAMFGAVCAPVEAFLTINGYDEDCDCVSGEDYCAGLMLERAGYRLLYDRQWMTLEWEEGHFMDEPMLRIDKGKSPNDKSHAILNMVLNGRNTAPNYFGPEGIRGLRKRVLAGEPFPVCQIPAHDWYDGQPLEEM